MLDPFERLNEYEKSHLLEHLRSQGWSEEQIQQRISRIPNDYPDKDALVQKYLEGVPEDERDLMKIKLLGDTI